LYSFHNKVLTVAVVYCISNVTSLYETEQLPCHCAPACRWNLV